MITLLKTGQYKLIETIHLIKVLYINDTAYAWVEPPTIGEILVVSHKVHIKDCTLSVGEFRIYEVEDEPYFSDQKHIELEIGKHTWQGYLLPTGLPSTKKKRCRIIPTPEVITGQYRLKKQGVVK